MVIPQIVTLEQIQAHLRLAPLLMIGSPPMPSSPADDPDLQLKLDAATEAICRRIAQRNPIDDAWITTIEGWSLGSPTAPAIVRLAVMEQVAEFYRFRGDDVPNERINNMGDLSDTIKSLLKSGGYLTETWA